MSVDPARQAQFEQDPAREIEVRLASGDDLAGVMSVGHRTWPPTYEPIAGPEYVAMGLAKWWTSDVVTDSIRKGRTIVAVDGGEVVGVATVGVQGDALALWKLYVVPGQHGRGIGSRLLEAVVARAVEEGHSRIVLSHIEGNEDAARFYRSRGFTETHRVSGGSGLPDSVWVERVLARSGSAEATHRTALQTALNTAPHTDPHAATAAHTEEEPS